MGVVAVAGGTGGVGRALVEAIKARGKHEVKILSRKANDTISAQFGVPIIVVDYSNVENLTKVFSDNNIDTVISALSTMPGEASHPEVNMILAAEASKTTRRFVLSNWGVPLEGGSSNSLPTTTVKLQAQEAVKKTNLEYTAFYPGFFTDFYAAPAIKTYMAIFTSVVDLSHNMAAIPGLGNTPIAFTHTFDLAKYVDATLDLEKWEPGYHMIGDKLTWNEFVKLAETVKGTKFQIVYDKVEDLRRGIATELPALTAALPFIPVPKEALLAFAATFGLMFEAGDFDFEEKGSLNEKFPHIKTLKIKAALEAVLKGNMNSE